MNHIGYTLRVDNNVLIVHCIGTWDERTAIQFSKDFKNAGRLLSHSRWADIVYFDEWEFSIPIVESIIKKMVMWANDNNMTHTARIYKAHPLKTYQLNKIVDSKDQPDTIRHFEHAKDGFKWLADHGFNVQLEKIVA